MAYASASDVAKFTHNILGDQPGFSVSSSPTLREVRTFLSSGCAIIEATLAGCQYTVPVSSGTVAYDWLTNLNALYAAAMTEDSRTIATVTAGERTRGDRFRKQFWDELEMLCERDMTLAGLTRTTTGKIYVGGISNTVKETYQDDSNRVKPRFARGQFKAAGIVDPGESTAGS